MQITHITKRDFSTKTFELYKITNAILKAIISRQARYTAPFPGEG